MTLNDRIERIVYERPGITTPEIIRLLGGECMENAVFMAVSRGIGFGRLVVVGTRRVPHSHGGCKSRCYALAPGCVPKDLNSPLHLQEPEEDAPPPRPRSKSGSGVIAPPPYATGYRWPSRRL